MNYLTFITSDWDTDFDTDYADTLYAEVADTVIDVLDSYYDGEADVVDLFMDRGLM